MSTPTHNLSKQELRKRFRMKIQASKMQRMGKTQREQEANRIKEEALQKFTETFTDALSSKNPNKPKDLEQALKSLETLKSPEIAKSLEAFQNLTSSPTQIKQDTLAQISKNRRKNERQRLRKLEKKVGKVSQETYEKIILKMKLDNYQDQMEKNHDNNILKLYELQNKKDNNNEDLNNSSTAQASAKATTKNIIPKITEKEADNLLLDGIDLDDLSDLSE